MTKIRQLREALVKAAIPLEVLNIDNHAGAKWMSADLRIAVEEAVMAIRSALLDTEDVK
jgi:hypothetical protein